MDNWYLPITIVPGLGLLILSTSNLMISLSNEICSMLSEYQGNNLLQRKLSQLKMLNTAMIFFYVAVAFLLCSSLANGMVHVETAARFLSIAAVIFALVGLIMLVLYSLRAVGIRQDQYNKRVNQIAKRP